MLKKKLHTLLRWRRAPLNPCEVPSLVPRTGFLFCRAFATFVFAGALAIALAAVLGGCAPRFNRQPPPLTSAPPGLMRPTLDLTAQGGGLNSQGNSSHHRLSRVAIGGNFRRLKADTPSGKSMTGGPGEPH